MAQSRADFKKIPEVDFNITSTGITVLCTRLYTPRFVPFDIKGRCDSCKADGAEIDFVVTIDGIMIYCTRLLKPVFVPFDWPYNKFPQSCMFRVKTRAKVFNIEHETAKQPDILNEAINTVFNNDEEQAAAATLREANQTHNQQTYQNGVPEYYNL